MITDREWPKTPYELMMSFGDFSFGDIDLRIGPGHAIFGAHPGRLRFTQQYEEFHLYLEALNEDPEVTNQFALLFTRTLVGDRLVRQGVREKHLYSQTGSIPAFPR